MNIENDRESDAVWERAIAGRLRRLSSMPVDTSGLDVAIRAQFPSPAPRHTLWFAPLRAIAASFVVAAVFAAVLLSTSSGPVLASAAQMAQVHEDIVAGRTPMAQVESIDAANRVLASQSPDGPPLPQVPESHVMACCMKSVHHKKMACVLLKDGGVPVTLAVANASEMRLPAASVTTRNGVGYRVQSVGNLSMVMTERNGKWLCLIGQLPAERLMDVAAAVKF